MTPGNLTDCINSPACSWVINMTGTFVVTLLGIVVGGWILYKYYKNKYKKAKRSAKIVEKFFIPWLSGIQKRNNVYCKIGAMYSEISGKMVRLNSEELSNLRYYSEVIDTKEYKLLFKHWKEAENYAIELNKELANGLFEELRICIKNEINLLHYCIHAQSDEPPEGFVCYNTFIMAVYDDIKFTLETERKQYHGIKEPILQCKTWRLNWDYDTLVSSSDNELVRKAMSLFISFIENKEYRERLADFLDKKKKTYDIALSRVRDDIENIIDSIELDNEVEKKVQQIVNSS